MKEKKKTFFLNNKVRAMVKIEFTYKNIAIVLFLSAGIIALVYLLIRRSNKFMKLKLRTSSVLTAGAASGPSCLFASGKTTIQGIQTQIATMQATVKSLSPAPTSDVLNTFNTTVASINTQITNLLSLPICCSGLNQVYNSTTNTCQCASPYGLDPTGVCSISCTSPQAIWTGGLCGCNTGYTLLTDYKTCDNASDDTINNTYIPQLAQFVTTLNSLTQNIPVPAVPLIGAYGGYTLNNGNALSIDNTSYGSPAVPGTGADKGLTPSSTITISQGQGLKSPDGSHIFVMEANGEAAVFNILNGNKTWNSGTAGKGTAPYSLVWGSNGGLSVVDTTGTSYWTTGAVPSSGTPPLPDILTMQNDGNLVLYSVLGVNLWSTGTAGT
jgi:hypothetical protein